MVGREAVGVFSPSEHAAGGSLELGRRSEEGEVAKVVEFGQDAHLSRVGRWA